LDKANVPDYVRAILVQETPPTEKSLRQKARDEGWDHSRLRSELNNHESVIEKEKDELYPFVSREGFSVQLTLCFIRKDIDFAHLGRTLKAFVLFGGVGGRVRRGFGSLELIHQSGGFLKSGDFLSTMEMKQSWIDSIQSLPPGCASLKEARVYCGTNPHSNATDAWHEAARIYQHFRKAEIPNRRRPSRGTGSHSTWPEADTIRQLKRISIINQAYNGFRSFPRAQLGLPLVFRSIKGQHGHFGEAELLLSINGTETSRLASPVILKPIRKQEKYYAAIIILNQTRLGDGDIKVKGFDQFSVGADCTNTPVGLWDGRSDTPFQHSHQNILDVLEDYLKTHAKWNQEVIAQL
jgi:CRISPR/Cas system CMR-associated protein Cmr1 (group 7 of RAMP superfamily)